MTLIRVLKCYKSYDFSRKRPIQVAFTADDISETLSIGLGKEMVSLDYLPIQDMVMRERAKGYKADGHYVFDETKEFIPAEWLRRYAGRVAADCTASELMERIISDWENECYDEIRKEYQNADAG